MEGSENTYQFKYTQVLLLISTARKQEIINDTEKKSMKNFIYEKEPNLDQEMEDYEKDKDLRKLIETLKVVCELQSMSSPLDTGLRTKKRRNQIKKKSNDNVRNKKGKSAINPQECDVGKSPVFNFNDE